ncbi:hypothetical protein HKX42_00665 [Salinisphaera sp. USBA-960]|uniref:hypothetical protein n=1 Tax=Salinisphaera orenii TaxID=856731 RepID=UPI000DBE7FC0|nr:hypothetical protein [Salifodinibacter halophilus]NNC25396.1 hypothetical protein [Salifodinibacter halophilus]
MNIDALNVHCGHGVDPADLLPHTGTMMLLATIEHWDAETIGARTRSFIDQEHPLALGGSLSAAALMEYGAQTAGAHAALIDRGHDPTAVPSGVVAGLQNVCGLAVSVPARLPALPVTARRLTGAGHGFVYDVSIGDGDHIHVTGQVSIVRT